MAGCQFEALITPKLSGQVTGTRVGAYVIEQKSKRADEEGLQIAINTTLTNDYAAYG